MLLSGAARRDAFGAPRAVGQVIESVLLDLALGRLAGARGRPSRYTRFTTPFLFRVSWHFRTFPWSCWRESRLGTVTEQVVVVPIFCLRLAFVSSSLFIAHPTSRK